MSLPPIPLSGVPLTPILVVGNSRSLSAPIGLSLPHPDLFTPELLDLRLLGLADVVVCDSP